MKTKIGGIDFGELAAERYWSFPKSYSDERKKLETRSMIFSNDYIGSIKKDGYYSRLIKNLDGEVFVHGRNKGVSGEHIDRADYLPHMKDFFDYLPNGTVLLGELYLPENEGSKNVTRILGCKLPKGLERQKKSPLHFFIFDIWALAGKSTLDVPARDRFHLLKSLQNKNDYVQFAEYYSGEKLWNILQEYLAEGGEGIVVTKADSKVAPGKRTARKTLKIKKELQETVDVIVIGANPPTRLYTGKYLDSWPHWENNITEEKLPEASYYKEYEDGAPIEPVTRSYYRGMAGSLKIGLLKKDKLIQVGSVSGLEDEILLNWKDYLGKIFEITAMEIDYDGYSFRHPKFLTIREDLTREDCTWEKVFGNEGTV